MFEIEAYVKNKRGLHARPSAQVAKTALNYKSDIFITNIKNNITANAKIILQIMLLEALHNTKLIIKATGTDERKAAQAIAKLINEFYIEDEDA